ncbi:MAG: tRNA (N6-isopentenyl adenosine(37)-C2)-methylthiotransferase MiaB, partial [Nitrospinae bacterium]|nr:tRNA (N6-isopentenyl adenosine(37)-C2)-methylthiotransferase MiaB [Nitrospinota bacterium]
MKEEQRPDFRQDIQDKTAPDSCIQGLLILSSFYNLPMPTEKNLALLTYGCQMNKYDSERIAGILQSCGIRLTDNLETADVIILNTCSIREKAEQKVYSQLGRLAPLKEKNPDLIIGVGGCVAQIQGEKILQRAPQVDLVFGTLNINKLPHLIKEIEEKGAKIADIDNEYNVDEDKKSIKREGNVHAWVSIMHGCDNYCTYCIVPYTRGREKSRTAASILMEIRGLAGEGFKEVTLLGQNVNSYGKDTGEGIDFPDLLSIIDKIKGIERIRFITSHPKDLSDKLIKSMSDLPHACEYLHLPIQAGSDRILSGMNRGYTSSDYLKKIDRVKESIPEASLSTDIIVGFPGETDDDFDKTKDIIKRVRYDGIYLFKYSPRPETPAAKFSDPIPDDVKQARFEEIMEMQKEITLEKNKAYEGRIVEALIEGKSRKDKKNIRPEVSSYTGRTRTNKLVIIPPRPHLTSPQSPPLEGGERGGLKGGRGGLSQAYSSLSCLC